MDDSRVGGGHVPPFKGLQKKGTLNNVCRIKGESVSECEDEEEVSKEGEGKLRVCQDVSWPDSRLLDDKSTYALWFGVGQVFNQVGLSDLKS